MSTLWDIEVKRLTDREATLQVVSVHPDAGPFRVDPTFALRLLYDPARELDDNFDYIPAGPLGAAASDDDFYSESWASDNAGRFITSVRTLEDDVPLDEAPVGATLTYVIETTEPRWLEHLSTGQRWDSAAY